jgi:hypothetical protein
MLRIKIGQCHDIITRLTELCIGHVFPFRDLTVGMEVVGVVERSENGIVDMSGRVTAIRDIGHVVDDGIHHEVHSSGMKGGTEVEQILMRTELGVKIV